MTRSRHGFCHGVRHRIRWSGAVTWLVFIAFAACAGPRTTTLTIFHTNDIHAHLERRGDSVGAAEVAGVIAHERKTNANVLVLDAGDVISETPVSGASRERAPFIVLARMGYDAMALGHHELDHGWRLIADYRELAPFPILCANAFGPDGRLLADAPSEVFEFGPLRVGVLGILPEDVLEHGIRKGDEGVRIEAPEDHVVAFVRRLREDVHLIVVLSHCGIETDRRLAREVPGIDIIVGGHSHTALKEPERIGNTWIVQTGRDLRNLGRLRVVYDLHERAILDLKGELLQPEAPVHPDVAAAVQDGERDLTPDRDDWYALSINGKKSGWLHVRTETKTVDGETRHVSGLEMSMALSRGPSKLTILTTGMTEENASGQVVRFEQTQNMGFVKKTTSGVLQPDGTLAIDEGGRNRVIPYPAGAIGPVAAERMMRERKLSRGIEFRFHVFSTDFLGRQVESHVVVHGEEDVDLHGRRRRLWRVVTTLSALPGCPETAWMNDRGEVSLMEAKVPMLGTMRMVRTEKAIAQRPGEPAEVFTTTLLTPDRAIRAPRTLERAVYRLSPLKGRLGDIVSGVGQTVKRTEDGSLRVEVDARAPAPRERFELPCTRKDMASFLAPSALLESDDARVIALAKEAVGDVKDPIAAAHAIEKLVRERIEKKNLNIGFASAAEVAEHLEGDCTEHGVLCAAMARAIGLPSRVVMGLVYLPPGSGFGGSEGPRKGIFAYHMWTEVFVGGNDWLPIDAAIGAMDATHIALARSDLARVNPLVDLILPVLNLMGNLRIEVIEP